jgi:flagellar protein FlgJ
MEVKLTPQQFVATYKPMAIACMKKTGLHYHATLTQAALESGWGQYAIGNNFFGIKDFDGVNGDEQLLTTTEYLDTPNAKFPQIISIVKRGAKWLYTVKDWFKKYLTPKVLLNTLNFLLRMADITRHGRRSDAKYLER